MGGGRGAARHRRACVGPSIYMSSYRTSLISAVAWASKALRVRGAVRGAQCGAHGCGARGAAAALLVCVAMCGARRAGRERARRRTSRGVRCLRVQGAAGLEVDALEGVVHRRAAERHAVTRKQGARGDVGGRWCRRVVPGRRATHLRTQLCPRVGWTAPMVRPSPDASTSSTSLPPSSQARACLKLGMGEGARGRGGEGTGPRGVEGARVRGDGEGCARGVHVLGAARVVRARVKRLDSKAVILVPHACAGPRSCHSSRRRALTADPGWSADEGR